LEFTVFHNESSTKLQRIDYIKMLIFILYIRVDYFKKSFLISVYLWLHELWARILKYVNSSW
jgi:hypothetical protein